MPIHFLDSGLSWSITQNFKFIHHLFVLMFIEKSLLSKVVIKWESKPKINLNLMFFVAKSNNFAKLIIIKIGSFWIYQIFVVRSRELLGISDEPPITCAVIDLKIDHKIYENKSNIVNVIDHKMNKKTFDNAYSRVFLKASTKYLKEVCEIRQKTKFLKGVFK